MKTINKATKGANSQLLQHVPIPVSSYRCDKRCCTRTFVPLEVSYARTIHKFQGLTAGPVDEGKIQNFYQCIVCDPDEKRYEGSSLGLLYTAVSRATTLGDENGLGSAIYFMGNSFKEERIRRLTKLKHSDRDFVMAQKRQKWVDFLSRKEEQSRPTTQKILERQDEIHSQINNLSFNYEFTYNRSTQYKASLFTHTNI